MPRPWTGSILIWPFSPKVPRPRRTAAISDAPQHEGRGKFRVIMHSKDLGERDIATGSICVCWPRNGRHQARRHEGELEICHIGDIVCCASAARVVLVWNGSRVFAWRRMKVVPFKGRVGRWAIQELRLWEGLYREPTPAGFLCDI